MRSQHDLAVEAITFWAIYLAGCLILAIFVLGLWTLKELWIARRDAR